MSLLKRDLYLIVYYILLLMVFISWQNFESVPSGILRIVYLIAVIIPLYWFKVNAFPAVIMLFYTIALFGFTTSYMPARDYTYLAATVVAVFITLNKKQHPLIPYSLIILFLIVTAVNLMYEGSWENISSSILLILMFFLIVDNDYEEQTRLFTYTFIIASLVLSLYYVIIGPQFIMEYRTSEGLDRIGFSDINYGGTIVGMGFFAAFVEIMSKKRLSSLLKILIGLTIAMSSFSMIMNASRGSVLAISASLAVIVLLSKAKTRYKLLIIVGLCGLVYFMYSKGYMDLLLYRVENDELGGGSGRTDIWKTKIDSFLTQANPFEWIFGMGFTGGRHLGWGNEQRAFHNDFLAFFVDYGIIGFITFLMFFFKPLKRIERNKTFVIAGIVFLLVSCLTLEPFTAGRLPFFAFWFYLLLLSKNNRSVSECQLNSKYPFNRERL